MKIYRIAQDTKSEEFKKWFGDWTSSDAFTSRSKVPVPSHAVNEDQTPKVMYHGSLKDFDQFELGHEGHNSNIFGSWKTTRHAIFFTSDPNHANAFTSSGDNTVGGNIKPVYLNIRSPLDFRNGVGGDVLEEFKEEGINPRWLINFDWGHLDDEDGKLLVNAAIKLGYDGIIFMDQNPETKEDIETWAVFDPSQIRSIYA